jgi:hypothetical protein
MPARQKTIIKVEYDQDLEAGASLYLVQPVGHLDMKVAVEKAFGT